MIDFVMSIGYLARAVKLGMLEWIGQKRRVRSVGKETCRKKRYARYVLTGSSVMTMEVDKIASGLIYCLS